jgi:hypothetical protein
MFKNTLLQLNERKKTHMTIWMQKETSDKIEVPFMIIHSTNTEMEESIST